MVLFSPLGEDIFEMTVANYVNDGFMFLGTYETHGTISLFFPSGEGRSDGHRQICKGYIYFDDM